MSTIKLVLILALVAPLVAASQVTPGGVSFEAYYPHPGEQVVDSVYLGAWLTGGDGGPSPVWVSAIVYGPTGQEVARVVLARSQEVRQTEGSRLWLSVCSLRLPPANYEFAFVALSDGTLFRSEKWPFVITARETTIPATEQNAFSDAIQSVLARLADLDGKTLTIAGRTMASVRLMWVLVAAMAIGAVLSSFIWLARKRSKPAVQGGSPQWSTIHQTLVQSREGISNIETAVADIFEKSDALEQRFFKFAKDVWQILDKARDWTEAPAEYIEPFRSELCAALTRNGIEEWAPAVGEKDGAGCDKIRAEEIGDNTPGTVVAVVRKGLRTKSLNGGVVVVKPPLIKVVPEAQEHRRS